MRKILCGIVILAVAALAVFLFLDFNVLVVKNVVVETDAQADEQTIIRSSGIRMGGKMRKLDTERLRREIERSGEWKCVSIEKDWPSTVVMTVVKRECAAFTEVNGNIALLDREGNVISVGQSVPEGMFLYVTGLSPRDAIPGMQLGSETVRLQAMTAVYDALAAQNAMEYVSELNVENRNSLYLYSRTGVLVSLGDSENMEAKIVWMKYALADLESRGETAGRLDVSSGTQADYRTD